jgi:uncharacterized repeat protein (TIGR01451 family)
MRFTLLAITTSVLASLVAPVSSAGEALPPGNLRPGAVLVGFRAGAAVASVDALAVAGYEVTRELPELNVVEVATRAGHEEAVAAQVAGLRGVAYAEPDYWAGPQTTAAFAPDDPLYPDQWALPIIRAPEAWSITTGSSSVIIAVIDSGVDLQHPDLQAKLWVNAGEIPYNGKDDDGNGKIDDVNGWHYYQACGKDGCESRENGLVMDDSGHGTHMAGIAAAATNNGKGVAGIAGHSPIMAVKVIDKTIGLAAYSDVAAGIHYAVNNGASILNISLGGSAPSQTLCAAVSWAASRGAVVVAAAGNQDHTVYYPAACPGALAVGATDRSDSPAWFSNPGARVDLAAPGVDILSTWFASGLGVSTYAALSGTSEAAPHIAAAAALVWARWPALTADGVKAQLQGSVVDVGLPGRDDESGWGRLDLAAALTERVRPVDLRLAAEGSPAVVVAGNPMTATFTISNTGTSPATSVTLSASLPADPVFDLVQLAPSACSMRASQMRCGFARLEPGASVSVTLVVTATSAAVGQLTTSATVNAAQRELTPSDNRQAIITAIRPVLWGRVFLDRNGDGIRQPWETGGVPDAPVLLERGGLPVAYTATELPGGLFRFDTLPSGRYTIIALPPQGYQFTTPGQVEIDVLSDREQSAFVGAWTGAVQPIPGRLHLPLILAGK